MEYQKNPLHKSKPELEETAQGFLNSKGGLSGFDRLGIYNQQYWFRLITIMQNEYICLLHLMGLRSFNQMVIRFLVIHPPASPFLAELDSEFDSFAVEYFSSEVIGDSFVDAQVVSTKYLQALQFDRAISKAIDAGSGKSVQEYSVQSGVGALEIALSQKLVLSPHVKVLGLDYDFASYRLLCLQDESLIAEFELAPYCSNLVIYRDRNYRPEMKAISNVAKQVLQAFNVPAKVVEGFEKLAAVFTEAEQKELETNLTEWFKYWIEENWLCLE